MILLDLVGTDKSVPLQNGDPDAFFSAAPDGHCFFRIFCRGFELVNPRI